MDWFYRAYQTHIRHTTQIRTALELHSRAASSVGVTYRSSSPNTGHNSRGGRTQKKIGSNLHGQGSLNCLYRGLFWEHSDCETDGIPMCRCASLIHSNLSSAVKMKNCYHIFIFDESNAQKTLTKLKSQYK